MQNYWALVSDSTGSPIANILLDLIPSHTRIYVDCQIHLWQAK